MANPFYTEVPAKMSQIISDRGMPWCGPFCGSLLQSCMSPPASPVPAFHLAFHPSGVVLVFCPLLSQESSLFYGFSLEHISPLHNWLSSFGIDLKRQPPCVLQPFTVVLGLFLAASFKSKHTPSLPCASLTRCLSLCIGSMLYKGRGRGCASFLLQ